MTQPNFEVALTKSICPVCAKTFDGDLVISKRATASANNYVKSLRGKILREQWCENCENVKKSRGAEGVVFLIEVDASKSNISENKERLRQEDAYRTGRIWAITEESYSRIFDADSPKQGIAFIDQQTAENLKLK